MSLEINDTVGELTEGSDPSPKKPEFEMKEKAKNTALENNHIN